MKKKDYIFAFVVIIMLVVGAVLIKIGIDIGNNVKPMYSYKIQKNNGYEVLLKPNVFYESNTLPEGRYYASKSIDDFVLNFKYNFQGNKKTKLEYQYNIMATLVATVQTDEEKKEIWTRNYSLLENKNKQENTDEFTINESVNIDYETYNNLVNSYERTYDIMVDAVLKIRFNISYNIDFSELGSDNKNVEDYIELYIPITNTVTEVTNNYENTNSYDYLPKNESFQINAIIFYPFGSLFMIGAFAILVIRIRIKKKGMSADTLYEHHVNRILRYYRELIVTVENKPVLDGLNAMEVTSLDDLIDIAEQNQANIIHYKNPDIQEDMLYVIVGNNYAFYYRITLN